jgi:hypothetical protein
MDSLMGVPNERRIIGKQQETGRELMALLAVVLRAAPLFRFPWQLHDQLQPPGSVFNFAPLRNRWR